jgi:hypothetical protein
MDDEGLQLSAPTYLVTGDWNCWRCGADMNVVALLCENAENPEMGPFILSSTATLPRHVVEFVQRRCPSFRLTFSKTVGTKYLANNCPKCGVISGDFFLHSEPGAPFFPTEEDEARSLTLEQIPLTEPAAVDSGCGYGTGDLILQYARRIDLSVNATPNNVTEPSDGPDSPTGRSSNG